MEYEIIYETPASWGNETYFFTEDKRAEFLNNMETCLGEGIEPPIQHHLNNDGLYESPYYKNVGRQIHRLIDNSDEADLEMEYIGTADY